MMGCQRRFPGPRALHLFATGIRFAFEASLALGMLLALGGLGPRTANAQARPPKNQASTTADAGTAVGNGIKVDAGIKVGNGIAVGDGIAVDGGSQTVVALDGPWRFHVGDDAAWADAALDDSSWEELSADRPWGEQGHASYAWFAWYRANVSISSSANGVSQPVALLVPHVDSAYEVYWNGAPIGSDGKLPPNPVYYLRDSPPRIFHFNAGEHGTLAFRVWKAPLLSDDS